MQRLFFPLLVVLALFACKKNDKYPETNIPKSSENDEIIQVVVKYQKAFEQRDLELLLDMASPDYYEDRGTLDQSDDYGLTELRTELSQRFSNIDQMRYTVKIKDIKVEGDSAYVDFHYSLLFQFKVGEVSRWNQSQDEGRLELKKVDGAWKVRSGL